MKIALILLICLLISSGLWFKEYYKPLRTCAKTNNVFQCSYVAVPDKIPGMEIGLLEEDE